jgi:hypothetical protein
MTLGARIRLGLHKARWIECAVRAVAIRALDESLGNTVMHGLSKLRTDRRMTGVAKIGLRGFQQAAVEPPRFVGALRHLKKLSLWSLAGTLARVFDSIHQVDRVTLITGNSGLKVTRVKERILLLAAVVAGKAAF